MTAVTLKWSIRSLVTAKGAPITTSDTYCKTEKEDKALRANAINRQNFTDKTHSTSQHAEGSLMDIHNGVVLPFVAIHLLKIGNKNLHEPLRREGKHIFKVGKSIT